MKTTLPDGREFEVPEPFISIAEWCQLIYANQIAGAKEITRRFDSVDTQLAAHGQILGGMQTQLHSIEMKIDYLISLIASDSTAPSQPGPFSVLVTGQK